VPAVPNNSRSVGVVTTTEIETVEVGSMTRFVPPASAQGTGAVGIG